MAHIDLDGFSLSDLKSLHKQVTRAIEEFADREKSRALAALEEKAREMGFSLAELIGAVRKSSQKMPGIARYRSPADTSATWTGKGRRPDWVRAALAEGKSLDELAI